MTGNRILTDPSAPEFPVVIAEAATVLVRWGELGFRCSADAAHALSDSLFQAALAVERQLLEQTPAPE